MSTITTLADKIVRRRVAVEFLGKGMSMADVALVMKARAIDVGRTACCLTIRRFNTTRKRILLNLSFRFGGDHDGRGHRQN